MSNSNLDKKDFFVRNLLRCMQEADVNQLDLAKALGITASSVNDWIKGRTYPRMDKVQLLAEYFGVTKSDLVDDLDDEAIAERKKDQEILDLFHKVPFEKRDLVLSMIRVAIDNL